jgi:hypothetical protein
MALWLPYCEYLSEDAAGNSKLNFIHDVNFKHRNIRRQTCDVDDGGCHMLNVECGLGDHCSIRLYSTYRVPARHICMGVSCEQVVITLNTSRVESARLTNVNLGAGNIERSAVESRAFRQTRYGVL